MQRTARTCTAATVALGTLLAVPTGALAQEAGGDPAAGAAADQVLVGSIGALVSVTVLLVLGLGHRSGRIGLLGAAAGTAGRRLRLPGWAALPVVLGLGAISLTGVGFVWDVALHLASGRDSGPFANPSHYLLIVGLLGLLAAGWFAVALPRDERDVGRSGVRITRGWRAPAGGVAIFASASFALLGFPADDAWHRLFGQDVTLWGPTHLMMITAGLLTLVGMAVLVEEGRRAQHRAHAATATAADRAGAGTDAAPARRSQPRLARTATDVLLAAALSVAFVIAYLQEFQYGVPQFSLLYHPIILALFQTAVLVGVRVRVGRGAALATAVVSLAFHGLLTGLNAFAFDVVAPWVPLFVVAGLLVEVAALAALRHGTWAFAALAALLVGTLGTLAEWAWVSAVFPIAWPASLMPTAIAASVVAAACGAVLGAFTATSLGAVGGEGRMHRGARVLVAPTVAVLVAVVGLGALLVTTDSPARAQVALREVPSGEGRQVVPTVRVTPASAAADPDWLTVTAWQGGDLVVAPLRRSAGGAFTTDRPIPVGGEWKTMVRLHEGRTMASAPLFLPADPGIPVGGVPATARFERGFVTDHRLMQRERKAEVQPWMWPAASAFVAAGCLGIFALLGWVLLRLRRPEGDGDGATPPPSAAAASRREPRTVVAGRPVVGT